MDDRLHRRFLREGVAHRGDPVALEAFDAETRRLTQPGEHATDCAVYQRQPCNCPVTKTPPAKPRGWEDTHLTVGLVFMALGMIETPLLIGWVIWRAFH